MHHVHWVSARSSSLIPSHAILEGGLHITARSSNDESDVEATAGITAFGKAGEPIAEAGQTSTGMHKNKYI